MEQAPYQSLRTMGRMLRLQCACMFPMAAQDVSHLKHTAMPWEENSMAKVTELGGEVQIPDLWRVSRLLKISSIQCDTMLINAEDAPQKKKLCGMGGAAHVNFTLVRNILFVGGFFGAEVRLASIVPTFGTATFAQRVLRIVALGHQRRTARR